MIFFSKLPLAFLHSPAASLHEHALQCTWKLYCSVTTYRSPQGRWNRQTWHRETWQRGIRLNRSQRLNIRRANKKSNVLNDKRIKSCLSRFDSGAYSRQQSAILSALIRSPCSCGSTAAATATAARTKTRTGLALAVPAAPTSGASESATAAAATTSDDCCEVCIVAPRDGFALVPCGHRTRRQYTRRRNDDKENF